jgi:hypothetical protein
MGVAIPKDSAVYIRYLDQGLNPIMPDAAERETMGWLTQELGNYICIQHDRTIESFQYSNGSASGIRLPKSSILEIHVVVKRESE